MRVFRVNINTQLYLDFLRNLLLRNTKKIQKNPMQVLVGYSPIHKATSVKDWSKVNSPELFDLLSHSRDLNPIENIEN